MKKILITVLAFLFIAFGTIVANAEFIEKNVAVTATASSVLAFSVDEAAIDFNFLDNTTGWQSSTPADLNLNMMFGAVGFNSTISVNLSGGQAGAWGALCTANGVRMTLDDTTYAGFVAGPVYLAHGAIGVGPTIFDVATPVSFSGQKVQLEIDAQEFMNAGFTDHYTSNPVTLWFLATAE